MNALHAAALAPLRITKMHGIGNDFIVVDCRTAPLPLDTAAIRRLADRHVGVGFDQLLTIEPARDPSCAFRYGIFNRDGSEALQCGNGVRCVAAWLRRAGALADGVVRLESPSGPVAVELLADGRVRVEMGVPRFEPTAIPLLAEARAQTYQLSSERDEIDFGAVSIGNPHVVLVVDDVATAAVGRLGPRIETDPRFPQRCNVGFAQVISPRRLALRVWERGVGETQACGSGACAAVAVLRDRGLLDERVAVRLPGGELEISWSGDGSPIWMSGPAAFVFDGDYYT